MAGVELDYEEHVDPLKRDGAIDVEEIAGQHGRRLGAQKLSPRRSVCPDRSWWNPQSAQNTSGRRRSSRGGSAAASSQSTPAAARSSGSNASTSSAASAVATTLVAGRPSRESR